MSVKIPYRTGRNIYCTTTGGLANSLGDNIVNCNIVLLLRAFRIFSKTAGEMENNPTLYRERGQERKGKERKGKFLSSAHCLWFIPDLPSDIAQSIFGQFTPNA